MREIASLTVELHIPHAESLKQKRQVIRSLKDRLRLKFNLAVAEVDYLDKWQRSILEIVTVANDHIFLESNLEKIRKFIDQEIAGSAQIVRTEVNFY